MMKIAARSHTSRVILETDMLHMLHSFRSLITGVIVNEYFDMAKEVTMGKNKVSLYSGIFFLVYGLGMLGMAYKILNTGVTSLGAGFMPKIVSILIIILSILVIAEAVVCLKTEKKSDEQQTNKMKVDIKGVAATIVLLAAYVILLKPVGFIIISIIYMFLQMYLLAPQITKKKLILYTVISIITPIIINYIFIRFFSLMLPSGVLG